MIKVITIGRQFGAGGRELGRALADRLGWAYYDKELLTQAAVSAGLNPELFERSDERAPSFLSGLLGFSHGNPVTFYAGSTPISDDNLYAAQAELIRSLADQRPCVIVGRTADYVLRDRDDVLSVFVHSALEQRVDRITRRHATTNPSETITPQQARSMAQRIDRLRANYYNFYTDNTWGAAASYHATFDSSKMAIPTIAEVITSMVRAID